MGACGPLKNKKWKGKCFMNKMDEQIIVVRRDKLFQNEELAFQGIERRQYEKNKILQNIADYYEIMRRGDAEENPNYKQPIPYIVIQQKNNVFLYKRLKGGGEQRLHDKLSIGVGGHMNPTEEGKEFEFVLKENLIRELHEELIIHSNYNQIETIGLINDDENEVGKVHIGLLIVINIDDDATVEVREKDQLKGGWIKISDLYNDNVYPYLESWSRFVADILLGGDCIGR